MALNISNATCGTMAFPNPLMDWFFQDEKVIPSNRAGIPSSPLQIGDSIGNEAKPPFASNGQQHDTFSFGLVGMYCLCSPVVLEWATNQTRSLLCGALTATAGITMGAT